MLTEIYISALLVDEELADQVWEVWDKGEISDFWAAWAWWTIAQTKAATADLIYSFIWNPNWEDLK